MNFSWLPAGRYVVNADGRPVRTKSARKQFLQGWACHYNVEHTNYKNGLREIFLPGCWGDSMYGVFFLRDHRLNEPKMADQDDGDSYFIFTYYTDQEKIKLWDEAGQKEIYHWEGCLRRPIPKGASVDAAMVMFADPLQPVCF